MQQPAEYRRQASACRHDAEQADCPMHHAMLLERAATWDRLAADIDAFLARYPDLTGETAPVETAPEKAARESLDRFLSLSSAAD